LVQSRLVSIHIGYILNIMLSCMCCVIQKVNKNNSVWNGYLTWEADSPVKNNNRLTDNRK